jgi:hypothetical protein
MRTAREKNHVFSADRRCCRSSSLQRGGGHWGGGQAYGNVGLSMGFPGKDYSLVGAMSPVSKVSRIGAVDLAGYSVWQVLKILQDLLWGQALKYLLFDFAWV